MLEKQDWRAWEKERESFKARETEGFTKDLHALKAHIEALARVAPKDKAGFPVSLALNHIERMQKFYLNVQNYLRTIGK